MAQVAQLILAHQGSILILESQNGWTLPGSIIIEGETSWDTLLREVWIQTKFVLDKENTSLVNEVKNGRNRYYLHYSEVSSLPSIVGNHKWIPIKERSEYLPDVQTKALQWIG